MVVKLRIGGCLKCAALVVCAAACDSKEGAPAEAPESQPKVASPATPPTSGASAKAEKPKKSPFPPEARRDSPPKAIAETALKVGAMAPALEKLASTSGEWSRGEKVTVLVFYRGFW